MRVLRFLNHNPLVPGELAYLREQFPGLPNWRYSAFYPLLVLGWLAALLPFVVHITADYTRLLAAMAVAIVAANGVTALRTVIIAARAMSRDFPPDRWETLITSGLNARQIVLGKWWAVVRHVWRWHLLTGLMRVGLALGIAQHIHASSVLGSCGRTCQFMCYPGLYWDYRRLPDFVFVPVQPGFYKIVLAGLVIIAGSGLTAGLAAALGMLGALLARRRPVSPALIASILYVLSAGLVLGILPNYVVKYPYSYPSYWFYENPLLRVNQTGIVIHGFLTALDGGTVVAASLQAPYEPAIINTLVSLFFAVTSCSLCAGLIVLCLQACQTRVMRGGGQPPPPAMIFLTLQERIAHWRTNPLIRSYRVLLPLRPQAPWRRVALWAGFAAVFAVAWTPRFLPLHQTDGPRLWILAGSVMLARAFTMLWTLIIATRTMRQGIAWEVMVLTSLDARQIIRACWWNAIRKTWGYHVVMFPVMLGCVYGLSQYLFATPIPYYESEFSWLERAFAHLTWNFRGAANNGFSPSLFQSATFRVSIFLLAFALAEAALLSAVGLLSALAAPRYRTTQLALAVTLRGGLALGGMMFVWLSIDLIPRTSIPPLDTAQTTRNLVYVENDNWSRIEGTAQIVVSPLADGGLAASNFYHPYNGPNSLRRKIVALTLGLGIYILLTALALWAAQKIAIRRGALPPD
jgi:hypothetical protein